MIITKAANRKYLVSIQYYLFSLILGKIFLAAFGTPEGIRPPDQPLGEGTKQGDTVLCGIVKSLIFRKISNSYAYFVLPCPCRFYPVFPALLSKQLARKFHLGWRKYAYFVPSYNR